jgi:alanyl-tRNA synthetase
MDEDEYRLDYFEENGFVRKKCPSCGRGFWTRDASKESCGEPPCDEYSFIGNPPFDDEYTLEEMREEFLSFFEDREHTRVDPYPVDASRWRDDVLLTQASIYDFQPLVTSGKTPPPANPLTISQPCIRMQDIDNVGKTGRHTLAFEMMAHHAFNSRSEGGAYEGEVYWKEETVEYCDGFLDSLGAPLDEVTYVESPWVGGGNAGPAFEVILRGAEVATLVFMDLEQDPEGEYEMKDGNTYSKMDNYIVDTGYGLERFTWLSQGTPTVYEAVYPEMVDRIVEEAGVERPEDEILADIARLAGMMDADEVDDVRDVRREVAENVGLSLADFDELLTPIENSFAVADHTRVLAYMLGDGIVPSNVGTGYLARLVLRRTVRLADEIGLDIPLEDLVDEQAKRLGYRNRDVIKDVVQEEVEKYAETLERGKRLVRRKAEEYAGEGSIPVGELVEMYDSHGIQPDTVAEIAADEGVDVNVPDDFYAQVADRHEERESADEEDNTPDVSDDLPETDLLFYDDVERTEFEAVVLNTYYDEDEDTYEIVLDQTRFYPEGGGQPADTGVLENGEVAHVKDVQIRDGVVFHRADKALSKGDVVRGQVDGDRRRALMRNHTATHVVIDAARRVLGDHVRQAGAQKGVESSRIDITHHKRLTDDDIREIERVANETVRKNVQVEDDWLDRHEAEEEYGFDLYQGGIPAGEEIRVVQVDDDVQACGGTHVRRTGDVGYVKIRNTERIQDGVERIVFSAGDAAIEAAQEVERVADEAAEVFGVPREELPETAERFFEEWKERGKHVEELRAELAEIRAETAEDEAVEVDGISLVTRRMDAEMDELRAAANSVVEDGKVAVFAGGDASANVVVGVPDGVELNAGNVAGELASVLGGDGGGSPGFGQGGGPDAEKVDDALEESKRIIEEEL